MTVPLQQVADDIASCLAEYPGLATKVSVKDNKISIQLLNGISNEPVTKDVLQKVQDALQESITGFHRETGKRGPQSSRSFTISDKKGTVTIKATRNVLEYSYGGVDNLRQELVRALPPKSAMQIADAFKFMGKAIGQDTDSTKTKPGK